MTSLCIIKGIEFVDQKELIIEETSEIGKVLGLATVQADGSIKIDTSVSDKLEAKEVKYTFGVKGKTPISTLNAISWYSVSICKATADKDSEITKLGIESLTVAGENITINTDCLFVNLMVNKFKLTTGKLSTTELGEDLASYIKLDTNSNIQVNSDLPNLS